MKRICRWAFVILALEIAFVTRPIGRFIEPIAYTIPENGCEIAAREVEAAVLARNGLHHYNVWARLVGVYYGWLGLKGHAYCVYTLGDDSVVAYDINSGTVPLGTKNRDIKTIARRLKWRDPAIRYVKFLD